MSSFRGRKYFHGAFTGGFSAGYHNTVGSAEGWTPSTSKNSNTVETYMDEEDYNAWGGPMNAAAAAAATGSGDWEANFLLSARRPATRPQDGKGHELLRCWGWRPGTGAAYVPTSGSRLTAMEQQQQPQEQKLEASELRQRKLRKILLPVQKIAPVPKVDQTGLGYEAVAPEFLRAKQQRQERARNRTNVYRIDTVAGGGRQQQQSSYTDDHHHHVEFETLQDFVGTKSVGGFALRDDEDDAFDDDDDNNHNSSSKLKVDPNLYDTEIGGVDNDNDDKNAETSQGPLGAALSAWAAASDNNHTENSTEGGLQGFVLSTYGVHSTQRFSGPDLLPGTEIPPHVFTERPETIKVLSHAEKLMAHEKRQQRAVVVAAPTVVRPRLFAAVGQAMKKRFTSASTTTSTTTEEKTSQEPEQKRTVLPFVPEPLLCKRLGVPVPQNVIAGTNDTTSVSYLDQVIQDARTTAGIRHKQDAATDSRALKAMLEQDDVTVPNVLENRPDMNVFRSIFAVQDTRDDTNSVDEKEESGKESKQGQHLVPYRFSRRCHRDDDDETTSSSMEYRKHRKRRKLEKKRKSHHRKHEKRRDKKKKSKKKKRSRHDD